MTHLRPIDYLNQGRQAREDGLSLTACPLRFKAWPYQAWCLGWHLGEIEANVASGAAEAEPLVDNVKTPRQQGQVAYAKGLLIDACPYDPDSHDWHVWRGGWFDADDNAKHADFDANCGARRLACAIYFGGGAVIIAAVAMWAFIFR